jgi:hypothetical protein
VTKLAAAILEEYQAKTQYHMVQFSGEIHPTILIYLRLKNG